MAAYSLNWLAWELRVPLVRLRRLALEADSHYHPFLQRIGSKRRRIDNPDRELKYLQRRIKEVFLDELPLRDLVHGCVKGRSPLTNARTHVGSRSMTHVDIKEFFPSVTPAMVYAGWIRLGLGPKPAALLTRLTTYRGGPPQGAPTSSGISNLVLLDLDDELEDLATQFRLKLTRYVDDITLSGDVTSHVTGHVVGLVRRQGFAVRHRKTGVVGAQAPHSVTGYTANNARGPSVSRKSRNALRAAAHELVCAQASGRDVTDLKRSILGRIAHLEQTNPGAAARVRAQIVAPLPGAPLSSTARN